MGFYDRHILPRILDLAMGMEPIARQRAKVVPLARGRVLEVGIGSGRNLAFYDRSAVDHLFALDPSPELRALAEPRARAAGFRLAGDPAGDGPALEYVGLRGEEIPLETDAVDTIVVTYTICTIPDAARALGEMRRVLRPDGRLLFSEHGRAPDASVARWQQRLTPMWRRFAGGCHLDRAIPTLLESAGFALDDLQSRYLPGPRPMTFTYWGIASPR